MYGSSVSTKGITFGRELGRKGSRKTLDLHVTSVFCSSIGISILFYFYLATTVLGWNWVRGDEEDFKLGPDFLTKRGSNKQTIDPTTGKYADEGSFEGKAIFVLYVSGAWLYGVQTRDVHPKGDR